LARTTPAEVRAGLEASAHHNQNELRQEYVPWLHSIVLAACQPPYATIC